MTIWEYHVRRYDFLQSQKCVCNDKQYVRNFHRLSTCIKYVIVIYKHKTIVLIVVVITICHLLTLDTNIYVETMHMFSLIFFLYLCIKLEE